MPAPLHSVMIPSVDLALLLLRACAADAGDLAALGTVVRVCRFAPPSLADANEVQRLYRAACAGRSCPVQPKKRRNPMERITPALVLLVAVTVTTVVCCLVLACRT